MFHVIAVSWKKCTEKNFACSLLLWQLCALKISISAMKKPLFLFFFLLYSAISFAQNIGVGTSAPSPSAKLEISSQNSGLLVPRLTKIQRDAIVAPATGLWIFQTDNTQGFYYNNGTPSVPAWARVLIDSTVNELCISDFGAVADGLTDNTTAIQNALNYAAVSGKSICIPNGIFAFSGTLSVVSGVVFEGKGMGSTSTATPYNGSQLKYTGNAWAMQISGQNVNLKSFVLYNKNNSAAALGGIRIYANNQGTESCILENILISGFVGGSALELKAENNGGIAYCSFYDVRVRHAKQGIHIQQDATSFVNSNSFYHGAISGGAFDYGLHVEGGNNNVFNGLIIEPYQSTFGHLVIESGSIAGNQIRIEGNSQPNTTPLIECKSGTYGTYLDGIYAGGLTLDRGNNVIKLASGKALGVQPPTQNLFVNAAFMNVSANNLPFWTITGTGVSLQSFAPEILANHQVIKVIVPAGVTAILQPQAAFAPTILSTSALYTHCSFGFYVKSSISNAVYTTFNAPSGMVTSTPHSGDNTWQFVGMNAAVNTAIAPQARLNIQNTGASAVEVYVTTPTFCFGNSVPNLEANPLSSGIMSGTLTMGLDTAASANMLVLPKTANVYFITGTTSIQRINDLTADRFPTGTIITLLFASSGISVSNSAYITLKSAFATTLANSSLTLVSLGNGTWREIGRNN